MSDTAAKPNRIIFRVGPRGVVLRPPCKETDLEIVTRGMNDPEITQYLTRCLPQSLAAEQQWFDTLPQRQDSIILAVEAPDGAMIGNIGLHKINWKDRVATAGVALMNPAYHNKGFGTEAGHLMLQFAFETLNLHKVESRVFASNPRSIALHETLGLRREGRLRRHVFINGRYIDMFCYGVFLVQWRKRWQEYQVQVKRQTP